MQAATAKGVDLNQVGQPAGDPALKRSFKGHKDSVCRVAFNPNLKQVVSGSADGTVMVWNFKSTMRPFRFVGHKSAVYDVKVAAPGNLIASCSQDCTIRLWNNTVEGQSQVIKKHSGAVRSISISANG
jgi:centriolar protein POC1